MNDSSAFKTVKKICVHSEVSLKPAEALTQAEKSYECEAAHDFLDLLFFLSYTLKGRNQYLRGHRSILFSSK